MHRPYGEKKKKKQNVIFVWFFSSRLRIFFRCAAHHVHEYMETAIIKLYYDACEACVTVIADASSTCECIWTWESPRNNEARNHRKKNLLFYSMTRIPGKTTMCPNNKLRTWKKRTDSFFLLFGSTERYPIEKVKLLFINVDIYFISPCQQNSMHWTVLLVLMLLLLLSLSWHPFISLALCFLTKFSRFSLVCFTFYCYYIYRFSLSLLFH